METPIPESATLHSATSLTYIGRRRHILLWLCECGAVLEDDPLLELPLSRLHPVPVVTWEHSREGVTI